jgi:hypothetical protein
MTGNATDSISSTLSSQSNDDTSSRIFFYCIRHGVTPYDPIPKMNQQHPPDTMNNIDDDSRMKKRIRRSLISVHDHGSPSYSLSWSIVVK